MEMSIEWRQVAMVAVKLLLAFGMGLLLATNPVSRLVNGGYTRGRKTVYSVALLCMASSLVIIVIGDSLARAFGVVGLGGFIRFRSKIRDPRDAVVYFLGIGTGMACGLGHFTVALVALAASLVMVAALDRFVGKRPDENIPTATELAAGRGGAVGVDKD